MADNTSVPIIVQGNSFALAIPLQKYVIDDIDFVLEDYEPDPTDEITIALKGSRRNYTYTPTINDGNIAKINLTGNELADIYGVVVSIVKANGQRLRSFRSDQLFIVESSDDLTMDDIVEGLEENIIYLNAQCFVAGLDGRGITSIAKTATAGLVDTYTITYTDHTTTTFTVTNGAEGVINDLTTGGSTYALSAEQGKVLKALIDTLDGAVFTNEIDTLTPKLLREKAYLLTNSGTIFTGNANYELHTYHVDAGSNYYIRIADGTANSNVYLYNWYATLQDAEDGTNALATISTKLPASTNLEITAPVGAMYLNVSFDVASTHSVDTGKYKTVFADYGDRLDAIENILPDDPIVSNLEKVNLFGDDNVMDGYIIDVTAHGKAVAIAQTNNYSSVAKVPAVANKWYCIYNPYPVKRPASEIRVGVQGKNSLNVLVDFGNDDQGNILTFDDHWIIAQARFTGETPPTTIESITFQIFRTPKPTPNHEHFPLVEVYEMDSANEAVQWVHAKKGQKYKLSNKISIDEPMLASNVATLSSAYKEKSVVIFGDSICANHAWSDYMMDVLKLRNVFNFGIGGAAIQYNRDDIDWLWQIKQTPIKMASTCYLQGTLKDGTYIYPVDCVFISLGHNDVGVSTHVIGDIDAVEAASWESLAPGEGVQIFSSVLAAFKYCIFLMKTTIITANVTIDGVSVAVGVDYTNAKFIYQAPIQTTFNDTQAGVDYTFADLRAAMREICEYYSVVYIDGWTQAGISKEEELLFQSINGSSEGKFLKDGTHPNEQGYIKIGEMNTSALIAHFI